VKRILIIEEHIHKFMPSIDITALVGLPEEDLLTIKASAITAIKQGSGVVNGISSLNMPGLSVSYFQGWLPTDVLGAVNYALDKMNKKTIRRTRAVFI
jgi:hypothetical protein